MTSIHPPTPPRFPLRKLAHLAYGMSVTVGALGQVLFLGERFGGHAVGWVAAGGLAAFAEVCMVACGDWSLEHRTRGRSWRVLLALGVLVSFYAAGLNASHWWPTSKSLGLMFAGASMIGFLLHVLNGHILVSAYLDELTQYQSRTKVGEGAAVLAAGTGLASTRDAAQASTGPQQVGTGTTAGTGTPAGTKPGTTSSTGAGVAAVAGLRLVLQPASTRSSPQAAPGTGWDRDLWEKAVRTAREYRQETGTDVTVSDLRERLSIGRNRALALRRDVLESGLGTHADAESGTSGQDRGTAGTETVRVPVPAAVR